MSKISRQTQDPGRSFENFVTIADYVNEMYFREWLDPTRFTRSGGSEAQRNETSAITFPNASTTSNIANFVNKDLWRSGYFSVKIFYSTGATTNDILFRSTIRGFNEDTDTNGTTVSSVTSILAPASSTVNYLEIVSVEDTDSPISDHYDMYSLELERIGGDPADTYGFNAFVHGVLVEFHPTT